MSATVATVLAAVLRHGKITRTALVASTGLSGSTVTRAVETLIADGLVHEADTAAAEGRGRPGTLVRPLAGRHLTLGVQLGASTTRMVLSDMTGHTLSSSSAPTPGSLGGPELGLWLADVCMGAMGARAAAVDAVGLGLPGVVAPGTLRVDDAPHLRAVEDPEFLTSFRTAIRRPLCADNDANFAVLGEYHCGAARGHDTAVLFTIDIGLGSGVLLDGRVVRGKTGKVGEWGNLPAGPNELPLEYVVTTAGILRRARQLGLDIAAPSEVFLPGAPDAVARLRREVERTLVVMLAGATLSYEPEVLILDGAVARFFAGSLPALRDKLVTFLHQAPPLEMAELGPLSCAVGASVAALQLVLTRLGVPAELARALPLMPAPLAPNLSHPAPLLSRPVMPTPVLPAT